MEMKAEVKYDTEDGTVTLKMYQGDQTILDAEFESGPAEMVRDDFTKALVAIKNQRAIECTRVGDSFQVTPEERTGKVSTDVSRALDVAGAGAHRGRTGD